MKLQDQLQPGEEILHRAHPSRIVLLPLLVAAVLLLVAGVLLWQAAKSPVFLWVGGGLALVTVAVAAVRHLRLGSLEYVLTDRRVVRQTGILAKSSSDAYLDKINNVEHRQTLWGRILKYGDVEIDTASGVGMTVFPMVSHPLEFKHAILAAAQDYRTGRRFVPQVASAGSAPLPSSSSQASPPPGASSAEKIRDLKRLLDEGLITQDEYTAKRQKLLDEM